MLPRGIGSVLGAFGALLLLLTGLLLATGVPVGQATQVSALLAFGSLGGGVLWGLTRRRRIDLLELVGMGAAIFTALYSLAGVMTAGLATAVPGWLLLIPMAGLPVAWWLVAAARGTVTFTPVFHRLATASVLLAIVVFALVNARQFLRYGLGPDASLAGYLPDLYLFESMGRALATFGPSEGGLMSGWPVRYHWLSYALGGSLTGDADLWPFVALTRVIPLLAAIIAGSLGASWARRLSSNRWTPLLAVLLLLVGTSIGPTANRVINWDSPSQSMTSAWLLALLLAAVTFARGRIRWGVLVMVVPLSIAVTAGKTSAAGIVLGALGFSTATALLLRRPAFRRLMALLATTSVVVAVTYLATSAGQAGAGFLEPSPMVRAVAGQSSGDGDVFGAAMLALGLLLAVLPRWIGLLPLILSPRARQGLGLESALGLGAALTASAAVVLISSSDTNQSWFLDAACVPIAIISAIGVERAWRLTHVSSRQALALNVTLMVLAAGLSTTSILWTRATYDSAAYPWGLPLSIVTLLVWFSFVGIISLLIAVTIARRTRRAAGPLLVATLCSLLTFASIAYGLVSPIVSGSIGSAYAISGPDGIDVDELSPSLEWLDANAAPEDIVATDFDSNSLSSALSERRPYAEWEKYSSTHTPIGAATEYDERRAAIDAVLSGTADVTSSTLCEAGVDWLIVRSDTPLPASLQTSVARVDERFVVLRIPC